MEVVKVDVTGACHEAVVVGTGQQHVARVPRGPTS